MSDPEAGESETPENPEPEDDAHLSYIYNESSPGAHSSLSHQTGSDTSRESVGGDLGQSTDDLSHSQENFAGSFDRNDNENVDGLEIQADGPTSRDSEGSTENGTEHQLTQQEWPVESDRIDFNTQVNNVTNCIKMEKAWKMEDTCTASVLPNFDCNPSGGSEQSAVCGAEMQAVKALISESIVTETSDQEESPPEDELFSAKNSIDLVLSNTEAENRATVGNSSIESAHTEGKVDANSSVAQHCNDSAEAESLASQACIGASDSDQNMQTLLPLSTASETVKKTVQQTVKPLTCKIPEKEDDQIPECDREQSKHASPLLSGHSAQCSTDSLEPKVISQVTDTTDTPHCSPVQQPNTGVIPKTFYKPSEDSCDNLASSDCDKASFERESVSPLLQPTSRLPQLSATDLKTNSRTLNKASFLSDDDSEDEDLLSELDAELHLHYSPPQPQTDIRSGSVHVPVNGLKDTMNTELYKQFELQLLQLQETVLQREREISRLKDVNSRQREVSQEVITERDKLRDELRSVKDKNVDDLYLPQIKELEYTISQQQGEVRQLKEKLTSHDAAAKRAIATLQAEMKARIDQITKLYEESSREKDAMVMKFAEAETKNIEAKCSEEKLESRVRDLLKEKEFTNNKMRAAMAEKQKAVAEFKSKNTELSTLQKELEKLKEEMSSTDYRIKWHQNKLKAELDAHKETKVNLEKMTCRLKEAKEETEIIRRDCQDIVKTYQESEEVRSNSLDKELKMKETELMIKRKEHSDTEEIHLKTKKELDALKALHKDTMEELKTLRDKVQCLEDERLQAEQVQAKYQIIIQNQKSDNTGLSKQLSSYQTLQEDFDRAQEMIKTLDHEVSGLKISNRDLQKDIEGCQARESKMLTLQSELSRTNALLRSENTNLNNQVVTLSGEVQKMKIDIQDLETRFRNTSDQLEEEQSKRKDETVSLSSQLTVKTKESEEYKQKWEDEIDASKTWKRKHNNNIKDLTRQLQHAKKRLEGYENGSGDRDGTSMGSRTNSNGSLNSMDNSNQHNTNHQHNHHPPNPHAVRGPSQEPEFPVITEQVEVDRQMLIERIVRLQRSLARKNEKLDFLEEHIQQLVTEIKKKNRIIQGYVVREEAGTLASDMMDANKLAVRKEAQALLARKGGIMASVYSKHQQDGAMTLDLSLEINKKLQAVLEDTLLKNMTLKENLDTLGAEIARLSQENRRLQLHLQGVGTH